MTKENMTKVLEKTYKDIFPILMDEAKKIEKDQKEAKLLAEEAYLDLKLYLETAY